MMHVVGIIFAVVDLHPGLVAGEGPDISLVPHRGRDDVFPQPFEAPLHAPGGERCLGLEIHPVQHTGRIGDHAADREQNRSDGDQTQQHEAHELRACECGSFRHRPLLGKA